MCIRDSKDSTTMATRKVCAQCLQPIHAECLANCKTKVCPHCRYHIFCDMKNTVNYQDMPSEDLLDIMGNIKQELLSRTPTPTKVLCNSRYNGYFELSDKVCTTYEKITGKKLSPYTTVRHDPVLVKIVEDMESGVHTENSCIWIKTIDLHPGERPNITSCKLGVESISKIFDKF